MPTTSTTFTTNISIKLADLRKAREHSQYESTILAYGTWSGGTMAFYLSPNNGTNKIPLTQTPGGIGISLTADGMAVITTGTPNTNTLQLSLWATLTGATSPSLTVLNIDNNN